MAAQDPFVGKALGKFQIERKLGQGGMGTVYKAKDNLGRGVALKLLPPHFAAQEEWVERFKREASKCALLMHPNVVQIFECDKVEGHDYISMQFMEGGSLEGVIQKRAPLPPAEAARIVRDAARGLARAHRDALIHRDIKPANILLGPPGPDQEVRLSDFGLVKSTKGDDQPLTQTGMVLGTPHYMAPEQCEGLPDVDGRADLYALGLVLYQALTNTLPVKGVTPLQIIRHRLQEDPPPLRHVAPGVPADLCAIVDALLVREPAGRLATADELVRRLDAFLLGPGASAGAAPPRGVVVSGDAPTAATFTRRANDVDGEPGILPALDIPPAQPVVPTARLVKYDRGPAPLPEVARGKEVRAKEPAGSAWQPIDRKPAGPPIRIEVAAVAPKPAPPSGAGKAVCCLFLVVLAVLGSCVTLGLLADDHDGAGYGYEAR